MDMKKILQALDGAAAKPAAGANDMKKFLSIVSEADINQPSADPQQDPNFAKYCELMAKYDMLNSEMQPDASGLGTQKFASPEFSKGVANLKAQADALAGPNAQAWEQARKITPTQTADQLKAELEENDMSKFLSIVSEGKDTKTNRLSAAEQMVFNDHNQPKAVVKTNPVLNKPLKNETLIKRYVEQVLAERAEELEARKAEIKERAARVVRKMHETAKVTKVDPGSKTVTYTDDATNVTTTVPQTMAKPVDGKVAVDQSQVAAADDAAGPEIKPGMEVDVSVDEISGPLRARYAHKARLKQAGAEMSKFFGRDDPEKVAKADREIARRQKGLDRVKVRTDKWVAQQAEKDAQDAEIRRQQDKENLPQLKAQLAKLQSEFDPNYQYIDAPSGGEWHRHHRLAQQIASLKHKINSIGEGDE